MEKLLRHQCEAPTGLEHCGRTLRPLWRTWYKLLAKKPEDRYQTPAELAVALAPFSSTDATLPPQEPLPASPEEAGGETQGLGRSDETPAPSPPARSLPGQGVADVAPRCGRCWRRSGSEWVCCWREAGCLEARG